MDMLVRQKHHTLPAPPAAWKRSYSRFAVSALGIALLSLRGVTAAAVFGQPDTPAGDTTSPKIILATSNQYLVQKFAGFLTKHQDKVTEHGVALVTRAAATFTFRGAPPDFQQILGDHEQAWSNEIGSALTVYVLPIDWQHQLEHLEELYRPIADQTFWNEIQKTARLIKR